MYNLDLCVCTQAHTNFDEVLLKENAANLQKQDAVVQTDEKQR